MQTCCNSNICSNDEKIWNFLKYCFPHNKLEIDFTKLWNWNQQFCFPTNLEIGFKHFEMWSQSLCVVRRFQLQISLRIHLCIVPINLHRTKIKHSVNQKNEKWRFACTLQNVTFQMYNFLWQLELQLSLSMQCTVAFANPTKIKHTVKHVWKQISCVALKKNVASFNSWSSRYRHQERIVFECLKIVIRKPGKKVTLSKQLFERPLYIFAIKNRNEIKKTPTEKKTKNDVLHAHCKMSFFKCTIFRDNSSCKCRWACNAKWHFKPNKTET